jgi:hypothetical protein
MEKLPLTANWDAEPLFLDESEAAKKLGVSVSFLRKARCKGCKKVTPENRDDAESAPPFVKLGGRVKYSTKDLRKWADSLPRKQVI